MARQAIVGVEFDEIPWITAEEMWGHTDLDVPTGVLVKVLSRDDETGATTTLIKTPPGWSTPQPEYHSVYQEDILLEGECYFGDKHLTAPAYLSFPPGFVHPVCRTETGCTMLVTLSGPFDITYVDESQIGKNLLGGDA